MKVPMQASDNASAGSSGKLIRSSSLWQETANAVRTRQKAA